MDRVDGGDDGEGRYEGRRYFLLIFLLITSYFTLSFNFSPLSFLLFSFLLVDAHTPLTLASTPIQ